MTTIPRALLESVKTRIESSLLCDVTSLAAQTEAQRLLDEALALINAELAKTVAQVEPVAWRTFDGEGGYMFRSYEENESYGAEWSAANPKHIGWVEPLYLHPPTPAWHDAPEVAALKAERNAAMKDAERYRWLRDATPWTAISSFDMTRVAFRLASKLSEEAEPDSGVELDAAIDAAIAKAEGRTE